MSPIIVTGINYDSDVTLGLFDPRCNDDTTTGPWMRIVRNNHNERSLTVQELEALQRTKRTDASKQEQKMAEINSNEMLKYLYETEQEQYAASRNLSRDINKRRALGLESSSFRVIHNYIVANWDHSRMPTILSKDKLDYEGNSKKVSFRQELRDTRTRRRAQEEAQIERNAVEGNMKHKVYSPEFIKEMINSRNALGLTQAQLANKISRKEAEISEIEKGVAVYDRSLMCLISWALSLN